LNVAQQITWLGHISEKEKIRLYAECLMVLFPSYNEDYGYVTPEGMLASKGVITLTDSGGSLEFVEHDVCGKVVAPDAEALGAELQQCWSDRAAARQLGENARQKIQGMDISWDKVCDHLVGQ
jgi:glycosyltransferase involved in cell wall biosynthesis